MNKINKIKQGLGWTILLVLTFILLEFALTGRLGIGLSIAFLPDNVAYIGGQ